MARSHVWAWLCWVSVCVVATVGLRARRDGVDTVYAVLTCLLIILGGSVSGGRPLGLALTLAGFLLIDYFFQVPYDTLSVSKPLDWIVLLAFLTTAVVTTQLLTRERARAAEAERRAGEVASLGRLGAEILSAGRAEESLAGIAELIRSSLDLPDLRVGRRHRAFARSVAGHSGCGATGAGLGGAASAGRHPGTGARRGEGRARGGVAPPRCLRAQRPRSAARSRAHRGRAVPVAYAADRPRPGAAALPGRRRLLRRTGRGADTA